MEFSSQVLHPSASVRFDDEIQVAKVIRLGMKLDKF